MRIAMVGTRGVPARYGGFETCVEEVGRRLVMAGHEVIVYCRTMAGAAAPRPEEYLGMQLVHLPAVRHKIVETLSHSALSVAHLGVHPVDVAVVFNSANSPFLPVLRARGIPVVTHVDGLEWKRAKWGRWGRTYYRAAEALAVRWSDALIADARGIQDYYADEFNADAEYIAYGAPVVRGLGTAGLAELDLVSRGYHLVVARMEPENNLHLALEGYLRSSCRQPLVIVGSAPYGEDYAAYLRALAGSDPRVRFLGGVWDQQLLDRLYANSLTYIHGHSVGGTNPSLLRAMGAGAATVAFDVIFNREVLGNDADYFSDGDQLAPILEASERNIDQTVARGHRLQESALRYDWDAVAESYEKLCDRLRVAGPRRRRPSGRRAVDSRWVNVPSTPAHPVPVSALVIDPDSPFPVMAFLGRGFAGTDLPGTDRPETDARDQNSAAPRVFGRGAPPSPARLLEAAGAATAATISSR